MDLVVYDDEEQRYVPLMVALGAVLLTGLLVAGLVLLWPRAESPEPVNQVTPPQAGAVREDSTCAAALEQADAALERGETIQRSLSEQTSLMDELLAGRATAEQVLDRSLPPLTAGAKDRQEFLEAVTAYQQARAECLE